MTTLLPLLEQFSTFGEVYIAEVARNAQDWLPLLVHAGWIEAVNGRAYGVTTQFLALPQTLMSAERQRHLCFAIPLYRRYLLAILAEGLVLGGQLGDYQHDLEQWVLKLAPVAEEINVLLDEIEAGQSRAITWETAQIQARFRELCAAAGSFDAWDRVLLGVSGPPEQLFRAVLDRAAALNLPSTPPSASRPWAMLPEITMPVDDTGRLVAPPPTAEFTQRERVFSSLPFFEVTGKPRYSAACSVTQVWQDMLAEHPYYRAVLRVAIAARLSRYDQTIFTLSAPHALDEIWLWVDEQRSATLTELLPELIVALDYTPLTQLTPTQVQRVVEQWIQVGVLEIEAKSARLQLCEAYACTLHERRRASLLLRGSARQEQERIAAYLRTKKK